jgi:syndecan 1
VGSAEFRSADAGAHDATSRQLIRTAATLRWTRPDLTATLAEHVLDTAADPATWVVAGGWLLHGRSALGDGRETACGLLDGLGRWGAAGPELMSRPDGRRLRVELAGCARRIGELDTARALLSTEPGADDGDPELHADVRTELAHCATADAPEAAPGALLDAERAWQAAGCGPGEASVLLLAAAHERRAARPDAAVSRAAEGLARLDVAGGRTGPAGSEHLAAALVAEWITSLVAGDRVDEVRAEALPLAAGLGAVLRPSRQTARLRLAVARVAAVVDGPDAVLTALEPAVQDAADCDVPQLESACRSMIAELHEEAGRLDAALTALRAAMAAERRDRERAARLQARLVAVAAGWGGRASTRRVAGASTRSGRTGAGAAEPWGARSGTGTAAERPTAEVTGRPSVGDSGGLFRSTALFGSVDSATGTYDGPDDAGRDTGASGWSGLPIDTAGAAVPDRYESVAAAAGADATAPPPGGVGGRRRRRLRGPEAEIDRGDAARGGDRRDADLRPPTDRPEPPGGMPSGDVGHEDRSEAGPTATAWRASAGGSEHGVPWGGGGGGSLIGDALFRELTDRGVLAEGPGAGAAAGRGRNAGRSRSDQERPEDGGPPPRAGGTAAPDPSGRSDATPHRRGPGRGGGPDRGSRPRAPADALWAASPGVDQPGPVAPQPGRHGTRRNGEDVAAPVDDRPQERVGEWPADGGDGRGSPGDTVVLDFGAETPRTERARRPARPPRTAGDAAGAMFAGHGHGPGDALRRGAGGPPGGRPRGTGSAVPRSGRRGAAEVWREGVGDPQDEAGEAGPERAGEVGGAAPVDVTDAGPGVSGAGVPGTDGPAHAQEAGDLDRARDVDPAGAVDATAAFGGPDPGPVRGVHGDTVLYDAGSRSGRRLGADRPRGGGPVPSAEGASGPERDDPARFLGAGEGDGAPDSDGHRRASFADGEGAAPTGRTNSQEPAGTRTTGGPAQPTGDGGSTVSPSDGGRRGRPGAARSPSTDPDGLGIADLLAGALAAYRGF